MELLCLYQRLTIQNTKHLPLMWHFCLQVTQSLQITRPKVPQTGPPAHFFLFLYWHLSKILAQDMDCENEIRQKGSWQNGLTNKWTASSEFGTYSLCEQPRFMRACAFAQSRQNLRCSLIQAVNQEEPSNRKPDPWPLWMAGHAQLKFVMMECSKTQIRLTGLSWYCCIPYFFLSDLKSCWRQVFIIEPKH